MIQINYRDPRPVYEQIMDELRKLIISGAIEPDEKLPSVRDLARQLAIGPTGSWSRAGISTRFQARAISRGRGRRWTRDGGRR